MRARALAHTALIAVVAYEPATAARYTAHAAGYDVAWLDEARAFLLDAVDRRRLEGTNQAIGALSNARVLAVRRAGGDLWARLNPTCEGCGDEIEPAGVFEAEPWRHSGCRGSVLR